MAALIGTSWKMNLTSSEAAAYCERLVPLVRDIADRELFVLPPFTAIWAVRDKLASSGIAWGAQHVHPEDSGAHTGDVSAPMLADLGCTYVEVGHAERRRDYGETNEFVAAQVRAVQRWGMTAIVCVGEMDEAPLADVLACLDAELSALRSADPRRLVIAYEPAWAIGVGSCAASPDWVRQVHAGIHERLDGIFPTPVDIPVIYGGSLDIASAPEILAQPGVDGLFVGRSALDPVEFARIAHIGLSRNPASGAKAQPAAHQPLGRA